MTRRAARVDANHRQIADALTAVGWSVVDFSAVGRGVPDLYVAKAGRQVWVEVKDSAKPPSARTLTPDQVKFHQRMQAAGVSVVVVESVEQAVRL